MLELKAATTQETLFAYKLPTAINSYIGLIGCFRADYGSDGTSFCHSFSDGPYKDKADKNGFKDIFNNFVNELTASLSNFEQMSKFCENSVFARHESGLFSGDYLFRRDEGLFSLIVKMIPVQGVYNIYIHCYFKEQLDYYIEHSKKGIRFINSNYRELFRIPNGGQITIEQPNGNLTPCVCYYIDDYHTVIGHNIWHICEFAEKMERIKTPYKPIKDKEENNEN